jgi:SAM-dependent methyltransferase
MHASPVFGRKDTTMGNKEFDPSAFKAQQREQWSNVAQGWRRRWPAVEQGAQALSDRMMELAHVAPGQRVLDVATGIGEPALTAARRVGPSGSVLAIDQAPQMLVVARERVQAAGIHNVEFLEASAETAALPPGSFDAVVCRWGLPFFRDPVATLAHLRSSLVPGGWLVAAVWGPPQHVPIIGLPFAALSRDLEAPPPPPPGSSNPFALSEPAELEHVVRDAEFVEVQSEPCTVTFAFASVDELVGHLHDVSAPLQVIMAAQPLERQVAILAGLAEAAAPYAGADGTVHLPNECLIVAGRRA